MNPDPCYVCQEPVVLTLPKPPRLQRNRYGTVTGFGEFWECPNGHRRDLTSVESALLN